MNSNNTGTRVSQTLLRMSYLLTGKTVIYQLWIWLLGTGLYLKLYLIIDYGGIFEARSLLQLWTECYCQFRIALISLPSVSLIYCNSLALEVNSCPLVAFEAQRYLSWALWSFWRPVWIRCGIWNLPTLTCSNVYDWRQVGTQKVLTSLQVTQ